MPGENGMSLSPSDREEADIDRLMAINEGESSSINVKGYQHTYPIHTRMAPSVLSKEAPPESYRGFMNLALLILAASNIRLVIENYKKYGFLISPPGTYVPPQDYFYAAITFAALPIHVMVAYMIERKTALDFLNEIKAALKEDRRPTLTPRIQKINRRAAFSHAVNLTITLGYPMLMAYFLIWHPFLGTTPLFTALILFLKLVSYALVNADLRLSELMPSTTPIAVIASYDVAYPNNVTFSDIIYFWFAPTMCYQPSYPRAPARFRLGFALRSAIEIVVACTMMYFLVEQYAEPTLRNSVQAMSEFDLAKIVERILKLSTVSLVIWLLMFYSFFHSFLNLLSELLRFGDRTFYLAWWNSGSLGTYWRLWNRPMYQWFKRHVYLPLVDRGISPNTAAFVVFTLSAVLHEILVGVPTHAVTGYAFVGIMAQIPLIAITKPLEKYRGKGTSLGNMIFWVSFCVVGQPACILFYYYEWVIKHRGPQSTNAPQ